MTPSYLVSITALVLILDHDNARRFDATATYLNIHS